MRNPVRQDNVSLTLEKNSYPPLIMAIIRADKKIHFKQADVLSLVARRYVIDTGRAQPGKAWITRSGYLPPQTLEAIGIAGKKRIPAPLILNANRGGRLKNLRRLYPWIKSAFAKAMADERDSRKPL